MKKLKKPQIPKKEKLPKLNSSSLKLTKSSIETLFDNLLENPTKQSCEKFIKIFRILV